MLELYLPPCNLNVCKYNDAWFDMNTHYLPKCKKAKRVIKAIDEVDYCGNDLITAKFGQQPPHGYLVTTNVTNLSTGCKTALNIAMFPDTIFSITECGDNAIDTIIGFSEGKVFVPRFIVTRQFNKKIAVFTEKGKRILSNDTELMHLLSIYFKNGRF